MADTGRPSTYSPEKAQSIIEHLSDGIPLREICRMGDMPAWRTVYDWMVKDESLSAAIARARDLGADAIAEDIVQIMDANPQRDEKGKIDPGWVQLQKLRVEGRLKLLAKWNPKKYGERLDLGNADGQAFQVTIAK
jgi:hypothetical protein